MKRSGTADLPLHYGQVPRWLYERMGRLGLAISQAIVYEFGKDDLLRRLSDPFWFQSMGAVMGMDWHSSGITTSVMGALKSSINPVSRELGIYVCGGKGKYSRNTPEELIRYGDRTGLNGLELAKSSRLSAKVDNTAIQDGFNIYLHSFIVSDEGKWTVVQQGMREGSSTARRYHWHSAGLRSFVETPHTAIYGQNQGQILNMTAAESAPARNSMLSMIREDPAKMITEVRNLIMPSYHDLRAENVDLKRLGAVLWLAQEKNPADFPELLLLEGLGPRTLQSMALVSEVIYGAPSRFSDPGRFSFAHGGKDGHPFPVPIKVYDETIQVLKKAVDKAKLDNSDKLQAIRKLSDISQRLEADFTPNNNFEEVIAAERKDSWKYGGRTVFGKAEKAGSGQLKLF